MAGSKAAIGQGVRRSTRRPAMKGEPRLRRPSSGCRRAGSRVRAFVNPTYLQTETLPTLSMR
jgi:hypothetical protein